MSQEPQTMPESKTASAGATPPAPPTETKVVPLRKVQKKISEQDFILNMDGSAYKSWVVNAAVGVTEADCLEPVFWTNVARLLKPRDHIEVWAVDGSWFADFRVIFADIREARVQKVHRADIDENLTTDINNDPEYIAKYLSPTVRYGVRRKSDNVIVAKDYNSLAEAEMWIAQRRARGK